MDLETTIGIAGGVIAVAFIVWIFVWRKPSIEVDDGNADVDTPEATLQRAMEEWR